jgi:aspartyl-tRNA(Asn)/glutamyl-tRNA(Gln) amidotransferase subunit A
MGTVAAGLVASSPSASLAAVSKPNSHGSGSDEDLAWLPAWRLREMFVSRKLSPVEYATYLIGRIDRSAALGAFISTFPEHLMEQARQAELKRGPDLPLLHGLPVSIKDNVVTKGMRTTYGSRLFQDYVPTEDSVPSERLKSAGAIIFGKSNLPEFALYSRTLNLLAREAVNPWDVARTSGGSSGGAAVAVAAGLAPFAIGTDGGGSIRLPSAFNGLFGLLPSRGRVPNGAGPYANPFSGIGPIARDVRDAALLLQVIAGYDARDPFAVRNAPANYLAELDKGVKGLRMVWTADFGRNTPDEPEVVSICHEAAQTFASLGADFREEDLRLEDPFDPYEPEREYSIEAATARMRAISPDYVDLGGWLSKLPREKLFQMTDYAREAAHTFDGYATRIRPEVRYRAKTRLDDLFQRADLLLSPTIARRAFVCGTDQPSQSSYVAYTALFNNSGHCAASVPAGFYKGMPVGLQIVGRPGDEQLVLRAARALERERPWADKRPILG